MITCDPMCSERTFNGFCKHSACIKPKQLSGTQENSIIFFPYTVGNVTFQNRNELEQWILDTQPKQGGY